MKNVNDSMRDLMRQVFDELREGARNELNEQEYHEKRELFAYHMTDWLDDLTEFQSLADGKTDPEKAAEIVSRFLYHVVPHITEAGHHLLDGVPNGFEAQRQQTPTDVAPRLG